MPVGIVVMRWDDRVGTEVVAQYPDDLAITQKTLMQVLSSHEYSGETGMISLLSGSINIASYYTGPENKIYLLLILSLDEDPDDYEVGLADATREVLANIYEESFASLIPSIFQRLSIFPNLTEEQSMAYTYQEEVKKLVIDRLRDEGVVLKSEVLIWLKDIYKHGFIDIDQIVKDLIKKEFVKEASVKGMPSEILFMTNDLFVLRVPPAKLFANPEEKGLPLELNEDYRVEVQKFFRDYKPNIDDNHKIINLLIDPQVYETLRLLRQAIVTRNDLEKLKKKGVDDIDVVLKKLWELQMIHVIQDNAGNEYYALISDIVVDRDFPFYQLDNIIKGYNTKSKANEVLVEYLNVLESAFQKSSVGSTKKLSGKIKKKLKKSEA
jgi:hypothetical protein